MATDRDLLKAMVLVNDFRYNTKENMVKALKWLIDENEITSEMLWELVNYSKEQ